MTALMKSAFFRTQTPTDLLGAMQNVYHRALYQLGPDVGCYAPPRLIEDAVGEKLRADGFENWTYEIENVDGALQIRHKGIDTAMKEPDNQ